MVWADGGRDEEKWLYVRACLRVRLIRLGGGIELEGLRKRGSQVFTNTKWVFPDEPGSVQETLHHPPRFSAGEIHRAALGA